ncbi:MAG TPA: hypothetical protein DDW33_14090 [Ktedonobacter sp.]|nr:hypothetical protein [Ktedonobacter sp.]HBE26802.1 hypothetical protein [Ktedonobacter sp.]HCF85231.1 hypothetical protein [Ktedonobacter sp.]HCJ32700.1 hypothetical protein [Ktedonobacter sp.]
MTRIPRCLVIDTDIARSAGGLDAQDMRSKDCREFLIGVQETKHKVVSTKTIREEWHKHQSRFTRTWLVSMVAQKKVCWLDDVAGDVLRRKVDSLDEDIREELLEKKQLIEDVLKKDLNNRQTMLGKLQNIEEVLHSVEGKRDAMFKDIHLIEAALQADRIVISMDETVRGYFREVTQKVVELRQIAWVNPCKSEETALEWLQDGAELERERLLGYRTEESDS